MDLTARSTSPTTPKVYLVGIASVGETPEQGQELLEELEELVTNLGWEILGEELVVLRKIQSEFFMGSGKAEAIIATAQSLGCTKIVIDHEIAPAQQRHWESTSKLEVIDREEVILNIFQSRAHTKEAVLQVELATLQYMLPRLKRAWTHLSRQRGGGALQRGEGETQLEIDQRLVHKRIGRVKRELKEVVQHRSVQRKARLRIPLPTAAIVGYTNAGKSSLLNLMTGSDVLAANKLFATLDPTTRRLELPTGQTLLVTDTVGFIRRLPHHLVEAFKATLEEALVADVLIHVVDMAHPQAQEHYSTTLDVLTSLGADPKRMVTVFNKIDLVKNLTTQVELKARFRDAVFMSVHTGEGLADLYEALEARLADSEDRALQLIVPHNQYELIHKLHEAGCVQFEKPLSEGVYVVARVPKRLQPACEAFKATRSLEDLSAEELT